MKNIEELKQQQHENRKAISTQLETFRKSLETINRDYYEQSSEYLRVIKSKDNEIELLKEKNQKYEDCIANSEDKKGLFKGFDLSTKEKGLLDEVIEFSNGDYQDLFKWGLKKDLLEQEDIDLIRKLINKAKLEDLKELELIEFLEMYEFLRDRGFKRRVTNKKELLEEKSSREIEITLSESEFKKIISSKNNLFKRVMELETENEELNKKIEYLEKMNQQYINLYKETKVKEDTYNLELEELRNQIVALKTKEVRVEEKQSEELIGIKEEAQEKVEQTATAREGEDSNIEIEIKEESIDLVEEGIQEISNDSEVESEDEEFDLEERKRLDMEVNKCLNFSLEEWKDVYKYVKKFRIIQKRGVQAISQRIVDIEVGRTSPTTPIEKQLEQNKNVLLISYYFEIYNSGYRPENKSVVETKKQVKKEVQKEEKIEEKKVLTTLELQRNELLKKVKEKSGDLTELQRMIEEEIIREEIFESKEIEKVTKSEWGRILSFGRKYELCDKEEVDSLNLILAKIGFNMEITNTDYKNLEKLYVVAKNNGFNISTFLEEKWAEIMVLLRLEESEDYLDILSCKIEGKDLKLPVLERVLSELRELFGEKIMEIGIKETKTEVEEKKEESLDAINPVEEPRKIIVEEVVEKEEKEEPKSYSFDDLLEIGLRDGEIEIKLIQKIDFDVEDDVDDYYDAIDELESRGIRVK